MSIKSITRYQYKGYQIEQVDDGYSIDAIVYDEGYHFWHTIDTVSTIEEAMQKIDSLAKMEE